MNWNTSARRRHGAQGRGGVRNRRRGQHRLDGGLAPPFTSTPSAISVVRVNQPLQIVDAIKKNNMNNINGNPKYAISAPVRRISMDMLMLRAIDHYSAEKGTDNTSGAAPASRGFSRKSNYFTGNQMSRNDPWVNLELSPPEHDELNIRNKDLMKSPGPFDTSDVVITADRREFQRPCHGNDEWSPDLENSPKSTISNDVQFFDSYWRVSDCAPEPLGCHYSRLDALSQTSSMGNLKPSSCTSFWDSPEMRKRPRTEQVQSDNSTSLCDHSHGASSFLLIPPPPELLPNLTSNGAYFISDAECTPEDMENQKDLLDLKAFL